MPKPPVTKKRKRKKKQNAPAKLKWSVWSKEDARPEQKAKATVNVSSRWKGSSRDTVSDTA